jgi:hypothetical protein
MIKIDDDMKDQALLHKYHHAVHEVPVHDLKVDS